MQLKTIHSKEYQLLIEKLVESRKQAGFSQLQVSSKINKSQSYISKIENCELRIDVIQLSVLAKLYKKEITFFLN